MPAASASGSTTLPTRSRRLVSRTADTADNRGSRPVVRGPMR